MAGSYITRVSLPIVLDEDNMVSDRADALATQQSIKAYVDAGDALSGVLQDLDTLGAPTTDGEFIVATGAGAFAYESGSTARTSLGLGTMATQADTAVDINGGAIDGVTLGTNSAVTQAVIDNIDINGNTISATSGAITITPAAGSVLNLDDSNVTVDGGAVNITGDLDVDNININGNTISSTDINGNINLTPNGTGEIVVSAGINFPDTQNASSDANTLDDYEQGTFTPTFVGSTSSDFTYSVQAGSYTKIGDICWCSLALVITSLGTSSGALRIGGLPFTIADKLASATDESAFDISFFLNSTSTISGLKGVASTSTNNIIMYKIATTGATSTTAYQITDASATLNIRAQFVYPV